MPEVSVVIPAYNAQDTLAETLGSLLSQTFADFEAIVIDDGSADQTARVARAAGDPRLRVLSVPNGGVARARNRGIEATAGAYVAFLDADDLWHPQKLELQLRALRADPSAGLCVTGATRIDARSREIGPMPLWRPDDVCSALLLHSMIVGCLSSGMVRRAVLEKAGLFDPRFSQSADWDLWLRLALETRFLILDAPLVRYRTSPGNMSSDIDLLERDTFAVLDALFELPRAAPYAHLRRRAYSAHWLVCAGSHLHAGNGPAALRCLGRALSWHPASAASALGLPGRWLRRSLDRRREAV